MSLVFPSNAHAVGYFLEEKKHVDYKNKNIGCVLRDKRFPEKKLLKI